MMPIYEFKCNNCDERLEIIMKSTETSPDKCEKCQNGTLTKIISKSNFVLKGSGWYETDFKNKKEKKSKTDDNKGKDTKDSNKNTSEPKKDSSKGSSSNEAQK